MSKRTAESEIYRPGEGEAEEDTYKESDYVGEIPRASEEELAKRKIFKVKRKVAPKSTVPVDGASSSSSSSTIEAPAGGFTWGAPITTTTTTTTSTTTPTESSTTASTDEKTEEKSEEEKSEPSSSSTTTTTTTTTSEPAAATGFVFKPLDGSVPGDIKFTFDTTPSSSKDDDAEKSTTTAATTAFSPFSFSFGAPSSTTAPLSSTTTTTTSSSSSSSQPTFNFDFSQPSSLTSSSSSFGTQSSAFASFNQAEVPQWGSDAKPNEEDLESATTTSGHVEENEVVGDFVARDVKFSDGPVKTGEEEENTLFQDTCKLFEMIKTGEGEKVVTDWKERGIGVLKVNVQKDGSKARLIMRKENVLNVILNSLIYSGMKCNLRGDKTVLFNANVVNEKGQMHLSPFLARFQKAESASKLIKVIEEEAAKLP